MLLKYFYMKKTFISLSLLCLIFLSCYKSPPERNSIVFKNEVQAVQDSLIDMVNLLKILPKSKNGLKTNYGYNNGILEINDSRIGNYDDALKDSTGIFLGFKDIDKRKFISLAEYLESNYLDSAYEESPNSWFFIYRYLPDGDFNDVRDITVKPIKDSIILKRASVILDRKFSIFLLAPKDAKIR